jgi:putative transcriptional regulator
MSKAGEQILEGLREAVAYARGDTEGARVHEVRVPVDVDVRAIRRQLGMSQAEFAGAFGFSVGAVRNWEQGARQPEGPTRAYLKVIARDPDAVRRALAA